MRDQISLKEVSSAAIENPKLIRGVLILEGKIEVGGYASKTLPPGEASPQLPNCRSKFQKNEWGTITPAGMWTVHRPR